MQMQGLRVKPIVPRKPAGEFVPLRRRHTPTAYEYGRRMGLAGRSYIPWLHFDSDGWREFYRGWLAGKRKRGAK